MTILCGRGLVLGLLRRYLLRYHLRQGLLLSIQGDIREEQTTRTQARAMQAGVTLVVPRNIEASSIVMSINVE